MHHTHASLLVYLSSSPHELHCPTMGLSATAKKLLAMKANSWARKELDMPKKGNLKSADKARVEELAGPKLKEVRTRVVGAARPAAS